MLKGYDAWKTRSDLDDADRRHGPERRCEFCDATLGENPWAEWTSDGQVVLFCDDCAIEKEPGEDAPATGRR